MVTVGSTKTGPGGEAGGREDRDHDGEDRQQHQPGPEVRHGLAGDGHDVGAELAAGVGVAGHPDAQRDGDSTAVSRIAATPGSSCTAVVRGRRRGRAPGTSTRCPGPVDEVLEVDQVLRERRTCRGPCSHGSAPAPRARQRSGLGVGRVAGRQADQHEHGRDREEDGQTLCAEPLEDVGHGRLDPAPCRRCAMSRAVCGFGERRESSAQASRRTAPRS